jgi:hypothetical protein
MSCGAGAQNIGGDAPPAGEQQGVLVLQDGGVLTGRITREDGRFLLKRDGTEVQIAAANVMLTATSLDDAYQQQARRFERPSPENHLQLAEWCLRHDLLDHAKNELAAAQKMDARSGKLLLLERRLALASERREKPATTDGVGETRGAPVQPTALQSKISDLPAGAVEQFTRRVQPILVNNCTAAGCHQAGGTNAFQLDRAILRGLANRRATIRNLEATLTLVDRQRPQRSPLLTVPRRKHGGMKSAIFGPRQEAAFRHLVDWVSLVAESTSSYESEATAENVDFVAAQTTHGSRLSSPVMRVDLHDDESEAGSANDGNLANTAKPPAERLRYGARLQRWQPRDPFDPEIFNRQSASREKAAASIEQPSAKESP